MIRPEAGAGLSLKVLAVMDSTGAGGAETSMAAMAPLLREVGIDFHVAFFHDRGGVKQRLLDAGVPIHHVRASRSRLVELRRLVRLVRSLRPDLVHTSVYEADIIGRTAGWLCGVPVISSIISDIYSPEHFAAVRRPIKLRLAWATDIVTARFVRQFHAVSATVAASVGPRLRIPGERVTVVFRGRLPPRPEQFVPRSYLASLVEVLDSRTIVVLAVGRQDPPKDFGTLIRAIAVLGEPFHLLIAGRAGQESHTLVELVEQLGVRDRVSFLGERTDVYELMTSVDVVALPSRWEGLPGVALESLAAGSRCVCSDLPVYREVFTPPDGPSLCAFFPAGDHIALAERLREVTERAARPEETREKQELFERRFELHRVVAQMSELYAATASSR